MDGFLVLDQQRWVDPYRGKILSKIINSSNFPTAVVTKSTITDTMIYSERKLRTFTNFLKNPSIQEKSTKSQWSDLKIYGFWVGAEVLPSFFRDFSRAARE